MEQQSVSDIVSLEIHPSLIGRLTDVGFDVSVVDEEAHSLKRLSEGYRRRVTVASLLDLIPNEFNVNVGMLDDGVHITVYYEGELVSETMKPSIEESVTDTVCNLYVMSIL